MVLAPPRRVEHLLETLMPVAAVNPLDTKLIAVLAAEGFSSRDISSRLNVPEEQVLKVLSKKETTTMIFAYQSALRYTPEQMIEAALPRAVEKKIFLMQHAADEKVQSANATEIIDRARGKPIQTTVVGKLNTTNDIRAIDNNLDALTNRLKALEDKQKSLLASRGAVIDVPALAD